MLKAKGSRISSVRGLLSRGNLCALQFVYSIDSTIIEGTMAGNCSVADSTCGFDLSPLERIVCLSVGCSPTGNVNFLSFETTFGRHLSFGEPSHIQGNLIFSPSGPVRSTGFTVKNRTYYGGLVSIAGGYSRDGGVQFIQPIFAEWSPATLLLLHLHHERTRFAPCRNFERFALDTVNIRSAIGFGMELTKRWIPDEERSKCTMCQVPFTFWKRKHHCRQVWL
jgi:hypothetical protein